MNTAVYVQMYNVMSCHRINLGVHTLYRTLDHCIFSWHIIRNSPSSHGRGWCVGFIKNARYNYSGMIVGLASL